MSTDTTAADREAIASLADRRREAIAQVVILTAELAEEARRQFADGATVNSLVRVTRVAPQTMARWLS